MTEKKIYKHPTVKQVIFQIQFPNLFYIESKIGDYQVKIMKKFPESSLVVRTNMLFVDVGDKQKLEMPSELSQSGNKVWQFKSPEGIILDVSSNSLSLTSEVHKTYNLGEEGNFRDLVKYAVDSFIEIVRLPIITRLGLRYIDECPIFSKDNSNFNEYYNSALPIERFNLSTVKEMKFMAQVERGDLRLGYAEFIVGRPDGYKLIMDFDGFKMNVEPSVYLESLDKAHEMISKEFELSIKDPLRAYMDR